MTPALLSLLSGPALRFRGWSYGPGGYDPAAKHVDCCSLTSALLHARYGWGDPDHARTRRTDRWADLCLWDRSRPWSAIERVVDEVHAAQPELVAAGPHLPGPVATWPGRIHLVQGWARLDYGAVGPASRGHAWIWCQDTGPLGWVVESSTTGPRLWCAEGQIPLSEAIDEEGMPMRSWSPMMWGIRAGKWTDVAWVVLP